MAQSYRNHAHRPIATYLAGLFTGCAFVFLLGDWWRGWGTGRAAMLSLVGAVAMLVSISRLYITALQNRIIRVEMHARLKDLLPAAQHAQIRQLAIAQLVALRFASDDELPGLVQRAVGEQLSRDGIKRAIRDWQPDDNRT
jgi:hypothetical protein